MWCELKDWQDVSDKVVLAKLARHLAALANYGGGYVLIGYNDAEEEVPIGVIDPASYTRDAINAVVEKYLGVDSPTTALTPGARVRLQAKLYKGTRTE